MTQTKPASAGLSIDEMPWPEFIDPQEAERERADDLAARLALLEAELRGLRGEETQS